MLTKRALDGISDYLKNMVKKVVYNTDGELIDAEQLIVECLSEGVVRIRFLIYPHKKCRVTELQIIDIDDEPWYIKEENIVINSVNDRFYYMMKINVEESEAEK